MKKFRIYQRAVKLCRIYGWYAGEIEVPEDDIELFEEDPEQYLKDNDIYDELEFEVDWEDCDVVNYGEFDHFEEVE